MVFMQICVLSPFKCYQKYIVAKVLYDTLSKYTDIKEPDLPIELKQNIEEYKEQLKNE